jgi:hypothetical protein
MTEDRKITIQRLEQTDLWALHQDYGQNVFCFRCRKPLAPGDTIVKVLNRVRVLRRLYHARCFNGAQGKDPAEL